MAEKTPVFVYGTLVGCFHDSVSATLKGAVKDDTGAYPTLMPTEGGSVDGEVTYADQMKLKRLDRYENEGYLYRRINDGNVHFYVGDPTKLRARNADYPFDRTELNDAFSDVEIVT